MTADPQKKIQAMARALNTGQRSYLDNASWCAAKWIAHDIDEWTPDEAQAAIEMARVDRQTVSERGLVSGDV